MEDSKQNTGGQNDQVANNGGGQPAGQNLPVKKPKTQAQIEREKARRKRRRSRKSKVPKPVDLNVEQKQVKSPSQASTVSPINVSEAVAAPKVFPEAEEPLETPKDNEPLAVDSVEIEPAKDVPYLNIEEVDEKNWLKNDVPIFDDEDQTMPPIVEHENIKQEPEIISLSDEEFSDQKVEEELHQPVEQKSPFLQDVEKAEESEVPEVQEAEINEKEVNEAAEEEVRRLRESLGEQLEEMPAKQGFFGHLFDLIQGLFARKKIEDDQLEVKESALVKILRIIGRLFWALFRIAIVLALVAGAYFAGTNLKFFGQIPDYISKIKIPFISESQPEKPKLPLEIDEELLKNWGVRTSFVFGKNKGLINENVLPLFSTSYYFGKLKEPSRYKETGMTSSFYFGLGQDAITERTRFEHYIEYLKKLRASYRTDIAGKLDSEIDRDTALGDFLDQSTEIFEEGNKKRKEILLMVDDFEISLRSLVDNKDKYETDFFVYLDAGEGAASLELLDAFIDLSKLQAEYKAKQAALNKLAEEYEAILIKIKVRNQALERNYDALIHGVKIVDEQDESVIFGRE